MTTMPLPVYPPIGLADPGVPATAAFLVGCTLSQGYSTSAASDIVAGSIPACPASQARLGVLGTYAGNLALDGEKDPAGDAPMSERHAKKGGKSKKRKEDVYAADEGDKK
jgi:hypothetical protein